MIRLKIDVFGRIILVERTEAGWWNTYELSSDGNDGAPKASSSQAW
jgi:hypothetical protein